MASDWSSSAVAFTNAEICFPTKEVFSTKVCPTLKPIKRKMSKVNNTSTRRRLDEWPTRLTVYSSCCFPVGFPWQRLALPFIWLATMCSLHVLPLSWFAVDVRQINHIKGQRSETIPMLCVIQRTCTCSDVHERENLILVCYFHYLLIQVLFTPPKEFHPRILEYLCCLVVRLTLFLIIEIILIWN